MKKRSNTVKNVQKPILLRSFILAAAFMVSPMCVFADWSGTILNEKPNEKAEEGGWAVDGRIESAFGAIMWWQWRGAGHLTVTRVDLETFDIIGSPIVAKGINVHVTVEDDGTDATLLTVRDVSAETETKLALNPCEGFVVEMKGYGRVYWIDDSGLRWAPAEGGVLDVLFDGDFKSCDTPEL